MRCRRDTADASFRPNGARVRFDLEAGATVEAPPVRLPFGASVSGQVVDERGEPVAAIPVYALAEMDGSSKRQPTGPLSVTDDLGRYRLYGLRAGTVLVMAEASSDMSSAGLQEQAKLVPTYYPDAVEEARAKPVTLRSGADLDGIDIRMVRLRTFRISGTVMDLRGAPYAGYVELRQTIHGGGSAGGVPVKPDGSFEITSVAPGSYQISVGRFTDPFDRRKVAEYASVRIEVSDGDVEGLTIVTRPAVDLSVRVEFEPEPPQAIPPNLGMTTRSVEQNLFSDSQALIDDDSTVVLKAVAGAVLLRPMGGNGQPTWFLKGVFLGTRDITDTPVEFTPADAKRVRMVLTSRGATITGTIADEKGAPLRDESVVLFPDDRSRWTIESSGVLTGRSDKTGTYKIRGVRAGQYRLAWVDRAPLNRLYSERSKVLESLFDAATPVTVGVDEQRQVDVRVIK